MTTLEHTQLNEKQLHLYEETKHAPATILQVGEGNFLRGFFDWMIYECKKQGLYEGSIAVTQPRPGGKPKIDALAAQDGLYTLVVRGLENGARVERKDTVSVFSKVFDPYSNWDDFLALAESPDLQIVVSNTTEAGLVYRPEARIEGEPIQSFPGKLTELLYRRYNYFNGDPERGLICLPCELLERNGDELLACILRYSDDWGYSEAFKRWVVEHNRFLNSLVDRIVTGYPDETQAEAWFSEWGYSDSMLSTAEPYHLWAIETGPELEQLLPLRAAGLNVHYVEDLKPFQLRKVRILNGSHTLMTPLGLLYDLEQVRETMEHQVLGSLVRATVQTEIIPSLTMPSEELQAYAEDVYERFLNPFIRHRLEDIAMNSLSKFKVRLLTSLLYYADKDNAMPNGLVTGLAGLLRYYKVKQTEDGFVGTTLSGASYKVRDDLALLKMIADVWLEAEEKQWSQERTTRRLLSLESVWGCDLTVQWPALAVAVSENIAGMEQDASE